MTASVLPQGKQYFETAAGLPAVGWKLYTYDTGTNNPRTTWLDAAQVTPNANPIVLDARGEAVVFWSGAYRVRLEDNLGNTIWSVDGISFTDPTSTLLADLAISNQPAKGAGMVGYGSTVNYAAGTVGGSLHTTETNVTTLQNALEPRQARGTFTLPATLSFFGDSFMEEPTAHTSSGHAMAYKAATTLGKVPSISATSGNTSADKQDAIFGANPAATDCWTIGLGQNDAQFIGVGTDIERRLNDVALIHLANHFQMGVPAGSRRILASAATTAGAWSNDADIAEGGSLKSSTTGDTLLFNVADSRFVVVIFKMKTANGGQFFVVIDGVTHSGSVDLAHGFHNYPFANIPTNTAKTFVRCALVFDLGRRKPVTSVQIVVASATAVGNVVTICSVMGLSGDPLAGPLVGVCDLTDRGAAGYATAAGSQSGVQCVSRIINYSLSVAGACGLRMVPIAISTVINPTTDLDVDQFHPKEAGAVNAALAISTALSGAARDWSVSRPDLNAISLVNGADGYVLQSQPPVSMGADFQMKRGLMSPRGIAWGATDAIPCITSVRISFPDANGFADPANALYLFRDTGAAGDAGVGNIGAGAFFQVAYGAIKSRLTQTGIIAPATEAFVPENDAVLQLGAAAKRFTTGWFSQYHVTSPLTVGTLPAAGASLKGARAFVTDATQTLTVGIGAVVAGAGANNVPVVCDGANWRIG